MKNAEQLIADMKADYGLHKKFHDGLNTLRSDETLSVMEAGIQVARELGYEISDDEAKKLVASSGQGKTQLNDDELDNAVGGRMTPSTGEPEGPIPNW